MTPQARVLSERAFSLPAKSMRCGNAWRVQPFVWVNLEEDSMQKFLGLTAVAFLGAAVCLSAAGSTPAAAVEQAGVTQELSAACRTVTTYRWSNGRRVA